MSDIAPDDIDPAAERSPYEALSRSIARSMDLDAGLADATFTAMYSSVGVDIARQLNLDEGLRKALTIARTRRVPRLQSAPTVNDNPARSRRVPRLQSAPTVNDDRENNKTPSSSLHDDELDALAERAADGDRDATERLLTAIRKPVVRYCRARMGESIGLLTPNDVAQEVLLAVFRALPRYRPSETTAMAFVYGIAHNKVVDAFRVHRRDHADPSGSLSDVASDHPGPDAIAMLDVETGELRGLLEQLPPAHYEVLVLRIAMQLSAEETASIVGSTPGAVRVTQHRATTKLRALLAERDRWLA